MHFDVQMTAFAQFVAGYKAICIAAHVAAVIDFEIDHSALAPEPYILL